MQALDLLLEPRDCRQTFIPSAFELAGDQPVIGINRVILPARMRRFVAGLFQGKLALPQPSLPARLRSAINCNAASMANGEIARSTSADTAASTRILLKVMHPFSLAYPRDYRRHNECRAANGAVP